jgi:hypothetical protein
MTTVVHIAADVGQVHEQRRHPITKRFVHVANLCGDDCFHA